MYIDYEILNTLRKNGLSMQGIDLMNAVLDADDPVFSNKVLEDMKFRKLITGDIHSIVSLTPQGCTACMEYEKQKELQDKQDRQFRKTYFLALYCAVISTVTSVAGSIIEFFK